MNTMNNQYHIPVMVHEVLNMMNVEENELYVDCTLGGGGHAETILERGGRLIGIDRDPGAIQFAAARLSRYGSRCELHNAHFSRVEEIIGERAGTVSGVLMDLGISSMMIDDATRGFSFMHEGPLLMTMGIGAVTAYNVVNTKSAEELAAIFHTYGEERYSRKIADAIVTGRSRQPIRTTTELAALIEESLGGRMPQKSKARIFQALRIYVNDELNELRKGLEGVLHILKPRGRLCVISYHSLEDRIVKQFIRDKAEPCICPPGLPECRCGRKPSLKIITRKPLKPAPEEQSSNPRSRSAHLRAAEKIEEA
jgi:16S rRNA (cytosine1402-N4)-methyltransferase